MVSFGSSRPWDRIPDFNRRLIVKQVDELYKFVPAAVGFSFIGSIAVLLSFIDTGETTKGLIWFAISVVVLFVRGLTGFAYRQEKKPVANPAWWGRAMLFGNILAGIQWGLLGTVFYPDTHNYREIFTVLIITSYVGGSITAFSPVKWVHLAMAIPASVPPAIYIFFIRDGYNWLGGTMALFFVCCVLFFSYMQYHIVAERLIVELDNEELLARSIASNRTLADTNSELMVMTSKEQAARNEASMRAKLLSAHVERTLLPIAECDRHFKVVAWNGAAEKAFGYRFTELSGQHFANMLLSADAQMHDKTKLETAFREDKASEMQTYLQTRNGQQIRVHLYVTPMHVDQGLPLRIGVIMTPLEADNLLAKAA